MTVPSLRNDATTALLRAVRGRLAPDQTITFDEIRSRSWASATFAGARHELTFTLHGAGAEIVGEAFTDGIESAEFDLRGHILADIAMVSKQVEYAADGAPSMRITIEALTVEDS